MASLKALVRKIVGCTAIAVVVVAPYLASARSVGVKQQEGTLNELPQQLEEVGITERLGEKIDLNLNFRDENDQVVPLGKFFSSNRPVLLSLAYYSCPSLCNFHLNGVKDVLSKLKWTTGQEFQFVVVSIDSRETAQLARDKKANYVKSYGRPEGADGWHFLRGDEQSVRQLAAQVGFKYRWDEQEQQWAHAAAAYVVTPQGVISRYLYGIDFDPETLRLSLVEASHFQVGTIVDRLILYCFHYDPKASKYTLYAFNVMRAGAVLVVLVLAAFLFPFWRRQRKGPMSMQGEV